MSRFALLLALLAFTPIVTMAQSIVGVWRVVERETVGGPDAGVVPESRVQPSFVFYTEGGHFASVGLAGDEPRPRLPDNPTDDAILESMATFYGRVSTYEVNGSTVTYGPRLVDQSPNSMLDQFSTGTREFRITGDMLETRGTNAEGVTNILRYRRVE